MFVPQGLGLKKSPDSCGIGVKQAAVSHFTLKDTYVDLHTPLGNGLDVKLGTFTETLGYEVYETGRLPCDMSG